MPLIKRVGIALLAFAGPAYSYPPLNEARDYLSHWHGFSSVKNLFVFGASYDATSQPYPGFRSSNGPNWVDYITTTFNQSLITSYDFAFPGATTDDYTSPLAPISLIPTIKTQVELEFLPLWELVFAFDKTYSDNSLFVLLAFPGNDIIYSAMDNKITSIPFTKIFEDWSTMADQLYKAGARNFVFNNLPNISKLPVILAANATAQKQVSQAVTTWNEHVDELTSSTRKKYPDVTIFQPDLNTLLDEILKNPKSHPETAGVTNTTGYCESYENGTPTPTTFYPECGIPVDQYLFLNDVHVQSPMHKAIAHELANVLSQ